jgi:hypothetical protein
MMSKVDETRDAGLSNIRAFPAWAGGQLARRRFKCGYSKLPVVHAAARSPLPGTAASERCG